MKKLSKMAVALVAVAAMAFGCMALAGCGGKSGGGSVGIDTVGYNDGYHSIVVKITNDTTDTLLVSEDGDLTVSFERDGKEVYSGSALILDPIYLPAGEETTAIVNYWTDEDIDGCVCNVQMGKFNPTDLDGFSVDEMTYDTSTALTDDGYEYTYSATYTGDSDLVNGFRFVSYAVDADGNVLVAETMSDQFGSDKAVASEGSYGDTPDANEAFVMVYPTIIAE